VQVEPVKVAVRRADWSRSAILGQRSAAARDFADLVADHLIGTVLPLTHREALVRTAAASGITRFEANLIIAAVQHQMGIGRRRTDKARPRVLRRFVPAIAVFLVVQAGIVAAAWYLLS
jgi:hypothetical protein